MNEPTQTIDLKALYAVLPESIKEIIFAPETSEKYDQLAVRFQLDTKQRDVLSAQTTFLLMGLRNPQELGSALATELAVDRQKASLIAQDLNRDLFSLIKEELKSLYAPDSTAETAPTPEATPTPAPLPAFSMAKATASVTPAPSTTPPAPTTQSMPRNEEGMPKPHIGNIFEEKLGGAFRVKSDTVQYSTPGESMTVPVPPTPEVVPQAQPTLPPPPSPTGTPQPVSPPNTGAPKPSDPYRELPM